MQQGHLLHKAQTQYSVTKVCSLSSSLRRKCRHQVEDTCKALLPSASHLYRGEWEEKKSSIKTKIIEQLFQEKDLEFQDVQDVEEPESGCQDKSKMVYMDKLKVLVWLYNNCSDVNVKTQE